MAEDTAISVANVSKSYRIWNDPSARLKGPIYEMLGRLIPGRPSPAGSQHFREFHAIRDVSFEVRRGESVGILGRNGSGKSTLLQIIAGTLRPTQGRVDISGRVAALLELGSGFNPEFTGRENVYLNAAVLGLSRIEIDERFDQIASFADIGEFMDQPVKAYSSGMMVRLAFAVSVATKPEILIVDEALAVGDAAFQRKCFRRIEELRDRGCTFLFVSHDINAVTNLCQRAVLLEQGKALFVGDAAEAGNRYQQIIFGETTRAALKEYGDGTAHFVSFGLEDSAGQPIEAIRSGVKFRFCYEIEFLAQVDEPVFGFRVTSVHGVLLLSTNTSLLHCPTGRFATGERVRVAWEIVLPVTPGFVFFSAGCSYADRDQFLCRKLDELKAPVHGTFHHAGLLATVASDGVKIARPVNRHD